MDEIFSNIMSESGPNFMFRKLKSENTIQSANIFLPEVCLKTLTLNHHLYHFMIYLSSKRFSKHLFWEMNHFK